MVDALTVPSQFILTHIFYGIIKEIPPKVEYSLTEFDESFISVLQTMMAWSETYLCPDYVNPYKEEK